MKTCENCQYWRKLGSVSTPRHVLYDSRRVEVAPGEEGQCRAAPPREDFRWPLTSAGDWCGRHCGAAAAQPVLLPDPRPPAVVAAVEKAAAEATTPLNLDVEPPGAGSPAVPYTASEPGNRRPRARGGKA